MALIAQCDVTGKLKNVKPYRLSITEVSPKDVLDPHVRVKGADTTLETVVDTVVFLSPSGLERAQKFFTRAATPPGSKDKPATPTRTPPGEQSRENSGH